MLLSSLSVVVALGLINIWKVGKAPAMQSAPVSELTLPEEAGWLAHAVARIPNDPFGVAGQLGGVAQLPRR